MDEHNLSQIVNKPTREQNYLDLTFMNYTSCPNRVETLPPTGDHDMLFSEADIRPTEVKKAQRKMYQYHRGYWEKLQDQMTELANEYMGRDKSGISVNELWMEIKDKI